MADIRIKDLATTATTTASDDFMAVDGVTNGTRKLSAATPAFLTSVTTPSLTSPAATNLTLGLGTGGTALTLVSSTLAATFAGSITAAGAGSFTTADATQTLRVKGATGMLRVAGYVDAANGAVLYSLNNAENAYIPLSVNSSEIFLNIAGTPKLSIGTTGTVSISATTAGASNAGALVVQGGISAGNTGSAASYFAGAVTATGLLTANAGALVSWTGGAGFTVNRTDGAGFINFNQTNGVNGAQIGTTNTGALSIYTNLSGSSVNALVISAAGATTFAGTVIAPAATASLAPLRIPHGTAPTSPTDGDMWTTTAGLFIRINGVTKTVTLT